MAPQTSASPSKSKAKRSSDSKRHLNGDSPSSKRRKTASSAPAVNPESLKNMYTFGSSNGSAVQTKSPVSPRIRRPSQATSMTMQNGSGPSFGAKRLVVKNLKKPPTSSSTSEYCAQTTKDLDAAITSILNNERPAKSNEELYRGCENVCRMQKAPELAVLLEKRCSSHVAGPIKSSLADIAGGESSEVSRAVVHAWKAWQRQIQSIRSIFFFLDRSHLLRNGQTSIQGLSVNLFRDHIFGETAIAGKAVDGACDVVSELRNGSSSDQSLFKDAVDMFHQVGIYTDEFEPRLLAVSQTFVVSWSDRECSENPLPAYVAACGTCIETEMSRCDGFDLDATTRRDLLALLEHNLIIRKQSELINDDSIADLLDADDLAGLAATYALLERRRLGIKLKEPFMRWIESTGSGIVFDEKAQDQMVVRLLELKQKLDRAWRTSFQKNQSIGHSLRETFELFINKSKKSSATWGTDNSKPGEMIAKYIDNILRMGSKAIPTQLSTNVTKQKVLTRVSNEDDEEEEVIAGDEDAEVENQLDQVLDLFRFVHGKAVFEAFYKKDLARRLLMGRSASNDAEKSMLNRLNTECGSSFTHNLEQMFRDVELARGEMAGYKERLQASDRRPAVDLSVNILSAAAWPTYPDVPCTVPAAIQSAISDFENYYQAKHTGRKLSWKHALAHCQIRARFNKVVKEIIVSSFQAIILLLFNDVAPGETLSYEQIKAESGLSDAEAQRTLQSLACAKLRPLTKQPKGRDVNPGDKFSVNDGFTHERYRVKINTIQMKETAEENKETHERVAADRQYETQAAIVRIMKSRKEIAHPELIAETIKATKSRGTLQPADIKRNIDKLIDKEYMERVEGNRYAYLA